MTCAQTGTADVAEALQGHAPDPSIGQALESLCRPAGDGGSNAHSNGKYR